MLAKKDELAAFHDAKGDGNYTDADMETIGKANADIEHEQKLMTALRDSEKNLGAQSSDGGRAIIPAHAAKANGSSALVQPPRPFNVAAKKLSPLDLLCRAGALMAVAQRERKPVDEICRAVYGDDEPTRAVLDWQTKAASNMAMTTVAGWAAELVQQIVVDFMATLYPKAIFPRFSRLGLVAHVRPQRENHHPDAVAHANDRRLVRRRGLADPGTPGRLYLANAHAEKNGGHHDMDARDRRALDPGDPGLVARRDANRYGDRAR